MKRRQELRNPCMSWDYRDNLSYSNYNRNNNKCSQELNKIVYNNKCSLLRDK